MLAQHQGFLISSLCFPPVSRSKELGGNTAATAGLNWSKGYSMLCNIMPTIKLQGGRKACFRFLKVLLLRKWLDIGLLVGDGEQFTLCYWWGFLSCSFIY